MKRSVRASLIGVVTMAAAATLFAAPAQAATHLPTCNVPAGQHCLAIENQSQKGAPNVLLSFHDSDGHCLTYNRDWGPGDIVGWPDIHMSDARLFTLTDAFNRTDCAGDPASYRHTRGYLNNGKYFIQIVVPN